LLGVSILNPGAVYATSWIRLQPEEVISRADIVVLGNYEFNGDKLSKPYDDMWFPFKFKVEKYYKGSGGELITAGIETFDVSWVKEFQGKGGSFLLFLERNNKDKDMLIPVAGPNGMIMVLNDNIQSQRAADISKYNDFLSKQNPVAPMPNQEQFIGKPQWFWTTVVVIIIVLIAVIGLLIKRRINKHY
jgi:hypothetical protein